MSTTNQSGLWDWAYKQKSLPSKGTGLSIQTEEPAKQRNEPVTEKEQSNKKKERQGKD